MPALAERQLELPHEHAEVGVVRPRVHLRDQENPHYAFSTATPIPIRSAPITTHPNCMSAGS